MGSPLQSTHLLPVKNRETPPSGSRLSMASISAFIPSALLLVTVQLLQLSILSFLQYSLPKSGQSVLV